MESVNPYGTPEANLAEQPVEQYNPKIFSMRGRIGRVRYVAYSMLGNLVLMFAAMLLAIVAVGLLDLNEDSEETMMIFAVVAYIPMVIYSVMVMKRRANDLDRSGWISMLMLVPVVNIIFSFYLLLVKGTQGRNRFGPAPVKNSGIIYFVIVLAAVFMLGIIAAIALPAYQSYIAAAGG